MSGLPDPGAPGFEHSRESKEIHQDQFRKRQGIARLGIFEGGIVGGLVPENTDFVSPGGHVFRHPSILGQEVDGFPEVVPRPLTEGDLNRLSAHHTAGVPVFPSQVVCRLEVKPPYVLREISRHCDRLRLRIDVDDPVPGVQFQSGGICVRGLGCSGERLHQCSDSLVAISASEEDGEQSLPFLPWDRVFGDGIGGDVFLMTMGA